MGPHVLGVMCPQVLGVGDGVAPAAAAAAADLTMGTNLQVGWMRGCQLHMCTTMPAGLLKATRLSMLIRWVFRVEEAELSG
jgi:hypothetical protein